MSETTRGSCLCQTVSYRFHGPVHVFQYCHCSRCRKFTGSAHAANIIVDPKNFEWLGGEDSIGRFEPAEARHFAQYRPLRTRGGQAFRHLLLQQMRLVPALAFAERNRNDHSRRHPRRRSRNQTDAKHLLEFARALARGCFGAAAAR
jgi:hypothetical protein